jgi:putative ABC transport system permease protein
VVRTSGDPLLLASAVKHAVYLETPLTPLDDAVTMESRTASLTDAPKRAIWLLGIFAMLALLLAGIGIFGVSAYLATQRRQEIGVRMALGAAPADIVALLLRGAFLTSCVGIIAGGLAAAGLSRFLEAHLFGVAPSDPLTRIAAAVTLILIAVLASGQPAWRAARSDPAAVLRRE